MTGGEAGVTEQTLRRTRYFCVFLFLFIKMTENVCFSKKKYPHKQNTYMYIACGSY